LQRTALLEIQTAASGTDPPRRSRTEKSDNPILLPRTVMEEVPDPGLNMLYFADEILGASNELDAVKEPVKMALVAAIASNEDTPAETLDTIEVSETQREGLAAVPPTRVPCETDVVPKELPCMVIEIDPVEACTISDLSLSYDTEGAS